MLQLFWKWFKSKMCGTWNKLQLKVFQVAHVYLAHLHSTLDPVLVGAVGSIPTTGNFNFCWNFLKPLDVNSSINVNVIVSWTSRISKKVIFGQTYANYTIALTVDVLKCIVSITLSTQLKGRCPFKESMFWVILGFNYVDTTTFPRLR